MQSPTDVPVAIEPPSPTAINSQQDLPLSETQLSFSAGPHASSFSCERCHSIKAGEAEKQLVWIDDGSEQMEILSTSTQLCAKCHESQAAHSGSQETAQFAHSDFKCTSCHEAHNAEASCTQSNCHVEIKSVIFAQIEKPQNHSDSGNPDSHMCGGSACHEQAKLVAQNPIYHQPVHRNVPCYVCHDVTGMVVIMEDEQSWMTVLDPGQGNGAELLPQVSHTIGIEVQCKKCHYADNAWALNEILPDN